MIDITYFPHPKSTKVEFLVSGAGDFVLNHPKLLALIRQMPKITVLSEHKEGFTLEFGPLDKKVSAAWWMEISCRWIIGIIKQIYFDGEAEVSRIAYW